MNAQLTLSGQFAPRFSSGFLKDHAGRIISDPKVALVELVANASDAGADRCDIEWCMDGVLSVVISDNGSGISAEEFRSRWMELSYDRVESQGTDVEFPSGNRTSNRKAYGRNGKGRHGLFCFADEYLVKTRKAGCETVFRVRRTDGGEKPFSVDPVSEEPCASNLHGTTVSASLLKNTMTENEVRDLLGTKFVADPAFTIYVNGKMVNLFELQDAKPELVFVPPYGDVKVFCVDSLTYSRTAMQHGVAWWVQNRLVGEVSWLRRTDESSFLDGRSTQARRFIFIVLADVLYDQVEADWTTFRPSDKTKRVIEAVERHIDLQLDEMSSGRRLERKREALAENRAFIEDLPRLSRSQIGQFAGQLVQRCPSMRQVDLNNAVEIFAKLEGSREGFALLAQLAKLDPNDLDAMSRILETWSAHQALIVLNELDRRLRLIEDLSGLVENIAADELHDIHPLLARGLWIFGPEYESPEFMSNRSLATVVSNLLHDNNARLIDGRKRPDIVALPDGSISLYSINSYDKRSEVDGVAKILILELKRGGCRLDRSMKYQAQTYAAGLRESGRVQQDTQITVLLLGASFSPGLGDDVKEGATVVSARTYSTVLQQAHARTFNLHSKLQEVSGDFQLDEDVEELVTQRSLRL